MLLLNVRMTQLRQSHQTMSVPRHSNFYNIYQMQLWGLIWWILGILSPPTLYKSLPSGHSRGVNIFRNWYESPPSKFSMLARLETSGVDINFPPTDSDFPVFFKTEMCHQLGPNWLWLVTVYLLSKHKCLHCYSASLDISKCIRGNSAKIKFS